jgi:hypothetical protein
MNYNAVEGQLGVIRDRAAVATGPLPRESDRGRGREARSQSP